MVFKTVKYPDDLAGCSVKEKCFEAYAILGEVLDICGLLESVKTDTASYTSRVFMFVF